MNSLERLLLTSLTVALASCSGGGGGGSSGGGNPNHQPQPQPQANARPVASLIVGSNGATSFMTGEEIPVKVGCTDADGNGTIQTYEVSDGNGLDEEETNPIDVTTTYSNAGEVNVDAYCGDDSGSSNARSALVRRTITITDPEPEPDPDPDPEPTNNDPVATLTARYTSGEVPLSVPFTLTCIDPDGASDLESFAFDSGNGQISSGSVPSNRTIIYEEEGIYESSLKCKDKSDAEGKDNLTITVTAPEEEENLAPTAVLIASLNSGEGPLDINFDASGSSDDKGISSYTWDFDSSDGIGVDETGQTTSHTFQPREAPYIVTLTVADEEGLTDTALEEILSEENLFVMSGWLQNDRKEPVSDADIRIYNQETGERFNIFPSIASNSDGEFSLTSIDPIDGNVFVQFAGVDGQDRTYVRALFDLDGSEDYRDVVVRAFTRPSQRGIDINGNGTSDEQDDIDFAIHVGEVGYSLPGKIDYNNLTIHILQGNIDGEEGEFTQEQQEIIESQFVDSEDPGYVGCIWKGYDNPNVITHNQHPLENPPFTIDEDGIIFIDANVQIISPYLPSNGSWGESSGKLARINSGLQTDLLRAVDAHEILHLNGFRHAKSLDMDYTIIRGDASNWSILQPTIADCEVSRIFREETYLQSERKMGISGRAVDPIVGDNFHDEN